MLSRQFWGPKRYTVEEEGVHLLENNYLNFVFIWEKRSIEKYLVRLYRPPGNQSFLSLVAQFLSQYHLNVKRFE